MKMFRSALSKRWIASVALFTLVGFTSFVACAQAQPEKVTIRYGYLPVPVVPLFAAVAYQLAEKEGIDLQLIKFTSGPAAFQALQSGGIDAAQGAIAAFYMASTRGLDARWVYSYGDYSPLEALVVPKGSAVREFKDLRGKKISAPTGSVHHLAMLYALRRAGMTPKDIEFLPLQPPQALAAVLNNDVDGAWFWDPFISQALEKGARLIVTNQTLGLPDPFGMAVNAKWLENKRHVEALGRLLRAFNEGQRRFEKDQEPTLAAVKSATGIDRALSLQLIKGIEWYTLKDQMDPNFLASLAEPSNANKGAASILKEKVEEPALWGGLITKRGNIPEFLDNRPARFALGN